MRWGSLLVALAAGCSLIRPGPAQYDYYVLTPIEGLPASERVSVIGGASTARIPVLVIGGVTLPGHLDRESIATRIAERQITYSQRDRWAEPLDEAITRTLRQDLSVLLVPQVLVEPRSIAGPADYILRVDVLRFERLGDNRVELWARYSLHAQGELVGAGDKHIIELARGQGASAASAALSFAIATISRDIAAATLALQTNALTTPGREPAISR